MSTPESTETKPEPATPAPAAAVDPVAAQRKLLLWVSIGLGAVLVFVVFVLPYLIKPVAPAVSSSPTEDATQGAAQSSPQSIEPWQEALQSKARRAAQDILQNFLESQFELEEIQVQRWAEAEFQTALQAAQEGDVSYKARDYQAAESSYAAGLEILQKLLEDSKAVFTSNLEATIAAISAGDAEQALAAVDLALAIKPEDADALEAQTRAQQLNQVLDLLKQGDDLVTAGQLTAAIEKFNEAVALDAELPQAQERLKQALQAKRDQDFTAAMSAGYAFLQDQQFSRAKAAFNKALGIKPNEEVVKAAIQQARLAEDTQRIARLEKKALQAVADENWPEAKAQYQAVLAIDDSVKFAQRGLQKTETRLELDQLLDGYINQSERVSETEVFVEATKVLSIARRIDNPGPRLNAQMQKLKNLLAIATEPVPVNLVSDNSTVVTLYKVGELGRFANKDLTLKPGRYTLVGKRLGFQDVRKELVVRPGESPQPLTIQCTLRI